MSYFDSVSINTNGGEEVSVQNPFPTNGDSVYEKDIDTAGSSIGTFTGSITDLVNDLDTTFSSTGHSSPATFTLKLERPISNIGVKFCSTIGKSFSNIKITLKDRSGTSLFIIDESSNSTAKTSEEFFWPQLTWCSMLVEFYTTDDIDLNWMLLEKSKLTYTKPKFVDKNNNSTVTPLGIGDTWEGDWISTENYIQAVIDVITDQDSAPEGLVIELRTTVNGTEVIHKHTFDVLVNSPGGHHYPSVLEGEELRISYTNNSSNAQTIFKLVTTLFTSMVEEGHSHNLDYELDDDHPAPVGRSVVSSRKDDGSYTNIGATNNNNLKVSLQEFGDTPSIDSFSRLRVSTPETIFDSKQLHDKQPLFWDESLGGSATSVHSSTNAATTLAVTANASDFVIRQTKMRFNYQPGKSHFVLMSFRSPFEAGLTKRVGLFDGTGTNNLTPNNGIFYETDGSISWNICKAGSITETVEKVDWNIDKLDGTGASKLTLDTDAVQLLVMDFQWLGVGRVRVGFVINGLIYYVHEFNHANDDTFTSVFISSPNLPLRYTIETDGTAGGSVDHICSTVMAEGGVEKTGIIRSIDTGSTHLDADAIGTIYAVLGLRLKTSYLDVSIDPKDFSMISETSDDFRWALHLNPTISGTFTYGDLSNSAIQYATGVTANTITNEGSVLSSGYASTDTQSASGELETALRIGSTIAGVRDELVLSVTPLSANADIQASLGFRELL